jgi:hypothetical protein
MIMNLAVIGFVHGLKFDSQFKEYGIMAMVIIMDISRVVKNSICASLMFKFSGR